MLKARQTGLSNAIAIEATHAAIVRPDTTILFVSKDQRAARLLISYCQHTIAGLRAIPSLIIENQSELGFENGSRIVSLPANPATGRAFAATAVYLDEFAYASYDSLIYESVIGTVATGGRMTVLSTPQGRNNMFFRLWSGLEGGDWSRHRVHWSDCPTYTRAWALATLLVRLLSVAGMLAPAAVVQPQVNTALAGALTSSGFLVRSPARSFTGTLGLSGQRSLSRLVSFAGALTSAGVLHRQVNTVLAGTLAVTGVLSRQVRMILTALIGAAGTVGIETPGIFLTRGGESLSLTRGGADGVLTRGGTTSVLERGGEQP